MPPRRASRRRPPSKAMEAWTRLAVAKHAVRSCRHASAKWVRPRMVDERASRAPALPCACGHQPNTHAFRVHRCLAASQPDRAMLDPSTSTFRKILQKLFGAAPERIEELEGALTLYTQSRSCGPLSSPRVASLTTCSCSWRWSAEGWTQRTWVFGSTRRACSLCMS